MTTPTAAEALTPLFSIVGFLVTMLLVYTVRTALFGRKHEDYIEKREKTILAKFFQEWWIWLWTPVERACLKLRLSPDVITVTATAVAGASGVLIGFGWLSLGGWVYLFASSFDFIDGRVARATGRSSKAGAFLDSTLDRVGELFVLGGLAVLFRDSPFLFAALAAAFASLMVSYARARGEALGAGDTVKVGGMQRPERVVLTGLTCALSPIADLVWGGGTGRTVIAGALVILAVLTTATAIRRTWAIYAALRAQEPVAKKPPFRLADVFRLDGASARRDKAAR